MNGELLIQTLGLKIYVYLCVHTYCVCTHFNIIFFLLHGHEYSEIICHIA